MKRRRFRRRALRRFKRNRTYLDTAVARFILLDMERLGGSVTPRELDRAYPMRYNTRYLHAAMKRMAQEGLLERGSFGFGGRHYKLADEPPAHKDAA